MVLQRLLASEGGGEGGVYTLGTDEDGNFRFARISGGRYRLSVRKDGYGTWQQELLVDVAGASREVVLEPTAGLELAVQLASGQRPRYVTVHVSDHAGGRGVVEGLPAGLWSVEVAAADGQSWSGSVVTSGGEAAIRIE